ncbi:MAG: hypothetical protein JXR70_08215 [Spirochaetales bacterium]|nr:hypothetical protein [Spirochaetales bacterium]
MKKATLLVLETHKEEALKNLRKLGVLHLNIKRGESADSAQLKDDYNVIENALKILPEIENPENNESSQAPLPIAQKAIALAKEKELLTEQRNQLEKQRSKLLPWGEEKSYLLDYMQKHKMELQFIEIQIRDLEKIPEALEYIKLMADDKKAYLGLLADPEKLTVNYEKIDLRNQSLKDIQNRLAETEQRLTSIHSELNQLALNRASLINQQSVIQRKIEFEEVKAAMNSGEKIAYVQGFVPVDELDSLKKEAIAQGWGLALEDPSENDPVPTKLKSWAKNLLAPIYGLLGTVPGYHEMDISFWFLLFFTLFFAMIIGDAGYGLVILGGILFARAKIKSFKGGPFILFFILSIATIIWGVITGTWFGYEQIYEVPILSKLIIPEIASSPADGSMDSMFFVMNICFILGTIHLVLAHLLSLLKKFPKLSFMGELGNIVFILAMFMLIQNLVLSKTNPTDPILLMTGIGIALIFIFSNQEGGNFIKGVLQNLANFLPLILGSIANFSDIISYIRLFAVGLATVKVADAFNDIAVMVGAIHPVAIIGAIAVILIGHGLNIVMAGMSVIVHGVRLKMLEFSGHLGMEWSGTEYKPFKEN